MQSFRDSIHVIRALDLEALQVDQQPDDLIRLR